MCFEGLMAYVTVREVTRERMGFWLKLLADGIRTDTKLLFWATWPSTCSLDKNDEANTPNSHFVICFDIG